VALESWALLTMEEAREMLGVPNTTEDVLIESLVNAATLRCENETGRELYTRTRTNEVYNGTGGVCLTLRQYPVTSVSAVSFLTQENPETWTAQDTSAHPLVIVQPAKTTVMWRDLCFPYGQQNVRLTYVAGLTSVPSDLKAACSIVLLDLYKQKDKVLANVASTSFQGQSSVYRNEPIPLLAARLLDPYRRLAC
jgi:uncharacterized phiE125 gp8 family phage protein